MLGHETLQVAGGVEAAVNTMGATQDASANAASHQAVTPPLQTGAQTVPPAETLRSRPRRWLFSVLTSMLALAAATGFFHSMDATAAASAPRQLVTTEGPALSAPLEAVAADRDPALETMARTLRSAPASVSKELVANIRSELVSGQPDALVRLSLFGELDVTVRITHHERTHTGGVAIAGQVVGDQAGSLALVINDDALSGSVIAFGKTYRLCGDSTLGTSLSELDKAPNLPIGHASPNIQRVSVVESGAAEMKSRLNAAEPAQTLADDGSLIDVMILYTPAARQYVGSAAQIEADIDAQIAFINLIYQNSGVIQRLRLVHKAEIDVQENNPFLDLYRLNQLDQPHGSRIAMLRNVYRADLVSIWGRWGRVCGIAFMMGLEDPRQSEYSVNLVNCFGTGSTILAHEFGHSMGLLHDNETDPGTTILTPEGSTVAQTVSYAHGYVDKVNRFQTLMAYERCSSLGYFCNPIPYFSNPQLTFDNRSYFAGAQVAPLGTVTYNNEARTLNDTRDTVANFRPSNAVTVAGLVTFLESEAKVDESAGTFTVQVHRLRGSTGAVSVNYRTVAVTAVPGTDYSHVTGTLNWADGDVAPKTITISILLDAVQEGSKQFNVELLNPTGGADVGAYQDFGKLLPVTIIDEWPDFWPLADAMPAGFTTPSDGTAWTVDTTRGYLSKSSLASAAVQPGVSVLDYTGEFAAGSLSFRFMMSSLPLTSRLELSIDGVVVQSFAGGEISWQQVFQQVSAGVHTIRWSFINSSSSDCICAGRAWLDDVTLPLNDSNSGMSLFAFVPNNADNTVSVVDIASRSVIKTLATGLSPRGVAASPDGKLVYVANQGSNSITVFDTLSLSMLTSIAVGDRPSAVAFNSAGTRAYVSHFGSGFVNVIDTATHTVIANIPMRSGGTAIAVNSAGTLAYVTAANPSQIQVLDLVAGQAKSIVDARFNPIGVAVTPDGSKVFAAENQDASVSMFNTPDTFTGSWQTVGGQPIGVAMSARLNRAYVTTGATSGNRVGNTVAVIDLNFQRNVVQIPVGTAPFGVAVDSSSTIVVAVNGNSNTVSIIDAITESVLATVPVGGSPNGLGQFIASIRVPTLPRNLVARPGNGTLSLVFDAPQVNGGSPVTNYVAQCQPGNISVSVTASPVSLTGLTNGTTYSCTVTAFNARGEGGRTAAVTATPLAGVQITSANSTSFTVLSAGTFNFAAIGSTPIQYSATGSLPAGVSLSPAGVLAGTPASGSAGTYVLNVTATNGTPPDAQQSFSLTIAKAAQQINFAAPTSRPLGSNPFTVSASGGGSGNAVVFSSQSPAVCTATGSNGTVITLIAGGTCVLAANQAGNADYLAAPEVTRSFSVITSQTITLGALPALQAGATVTLTATGGVSGNPVVFTSATPAICTVAGTNGSQLSGLAVGTCTIKANQAGSATINPAPEVSANISVTRGSQVITFFNAQLPINIDTNPIESSGKSGNPVTLVSLTPAACTIVNGRVRATEFAVCTLVASQAGNANFAPAADVTQSFQGYSLMPQTRFGHSTHALPDGRILLFAGMQASGGLLDRVYHFNPQQKTWVLASGPSFFPRVGHASVETEFYVAMVGGAHPAGGFATAYSAYIVEAGFPFGSTNETWLDSLRRTGHAITAFPNNEVHVTGGTGMDGSSANYSKIYSLQNNSLVNTSPMLAERTQHAAVKLGTNVTMVIGGLGANSTVLNTTETMSYASKTWAAAAPLSVARQGHRAVRLQSGQVLVVGGVDAAAQPVSQAEIYDPQSGVWSSAGTVTGGTGHSLTLLGDGRVVVAGGVGRERKVNLYNPLSNTWTSLPDLVFPHVAHAAALLPDGRVLISGGHDGNPANAHAGAEAIGPDLTLKGQTLPDARLGESYLPTQLTALGGTAPFSFSLAGGALPPGMTLSTGGVVSGVPGTEATFNFNVTVIDATGLTSTAQFVLGVTQPLVSVTASVSGQGTMTPTGVLSTPRGSVLSFEITAYTGYSPSVGGTCGGTLSGSTYTTLALAGDCTVVTTFVQSLFPPSAPLNVSAVGGVYSAIVSFSPPANDGGAPVSGYQVECIGDGRFYATASGTSSPITVDGIFTGYLYVCTVQAGNSMGPGAVSAPSNSFQALVPPVTLTARVLGTGAANGRVTGLAGGINCPGDCTESIAVGGVVSLTASTINGGLFSGWLGTGLLCREGNDSTTCTFNMPATAYTVTGSFPTAASAPGAPQILATSPGPGSINVQFQRPVSGGSPITSFTATCTPSTGTAVTVTGTSSPILITGLTPGVSHTCRMSATNAIGTSALSAASAAVTPLQPALPNYTLTVTAAGTGRGSVVSSPAGITCGSQCSADFASGTVVTLTASPVVGSNFVGWSGGTGSANCTGTAPCTVTVTAASSITATFEPPRYTVTPSAGANGSISPAAPQSVLLNGTATFTVTPQAGYAATVAGTCGGTLVGNTYTTLLISADCTVIASFTLAPVVLQVSKSGTGQGGVTSSPAGISCGADCSESLAVGTVVTLTATPDAGSVFAGWSGVTCTGGNSAATCGFTLNANTMVTATFNTTAAANVALHDLNDDGKSDIVWRNDSTGTNWYWALNGTTIVAQGAITTLPLDWQIQSTAVDFDGDGKSDILLRNMTTGQPWVWFMNGNSIIGGGALPTLSDMNWTIAGTGDLNGDGKGDVVWRNTATGQNWWWALNGTSIINQGQITALPPEWVIQSTLGDFNGDGKTDILWRNMTTGQPWVWMMDGNNLIANGPLPTLSDLSWIIAGTGDLNGDGKHDVVWRNTSTGANWYWALNGTTIISQGAITTLPPEWSFQSTSADFNGDGKADILLRNLTTGQPWIWLMNGNTITGGGALPTLSDLAWQIRIRK